jgi:hypothetical protein
MKKLFFLVLLSSIVLVAQEILILGDKNFPEDKLSKEEVRAIFLDKKHFLGGEKVLAMNYTFNHPLRLCLERTILEKSERSLERYWRKAYYNGKRPPKVVTSVEMLFSYFENVHPTIGYVDANETIDKGLKVLYKGECP